MKAETLKQFNNIKAITGNGSWCPIDRLLIERGRLLEALELLFGLIESEELVRNISRDSDPNWHVRMIGFTSTLNKSLAAIDFAEADEETTPFS